MQKTIRLEGAHRKVDNSTKRRVAMVAVAASAVSTAGAAGAAAAATQKTEQKDIVLAADTKVLAQSAPAEAEAPQILQIPQAKELADLAGQLDSVLRFAEERAAADLAARTTPAEVSAAIDAGVPGAAESATVVGGFASPAAGVFTSGFGPRWGTIHQGIDIAAPVGTPIYAVMAGTVIDSGPASGFGNWIRILHDDGTVTVYGHMVSLDVSVGQRVEAGQKIAGMGNEGFSTGSHLHFEVRPGGGAAIDPVPWLAARGISV